MKYLYDLEPRQYRPCFKVILRGIAIVGWPDKEQLGRGVQLDDGWRLSILSVLHFEYTKYKGRRLSIRISKW